MTAVAVLLAAALGGAYGAWLRRALAAGGYRSSAETGPIPAKRWLAPVAAPTVAALVWHLGDVHRWGLLPAYAALVAVALPLAAIDLDVHRLPDRLTLPAIPTLALLLALEGDRHRLMQALVCGALAGAVLLLLALAVPGGMGLGDVKLAALLGMPLGWWGWVVPVQGLAGGFVIGGLVSLVLVLTRRATRHTHIALGPSLLLGALGALLTAT